MIPGIHCQIIKIYIKIGIFRQLLPINYVRTTSIESIIILNNIQNEHYKQPNGLKYDWYAHERNAATTTDATRTIPASSDA